MSSVPKLRGDLKWASNKKKVLVLNKDPVSDKRSCREFTAVYAKVECESVLFFGGLQEWHQGKNVALAAVGHQVPLLLTLFWWGYDGVDACPLRHQAVQHLAQAGRVLVPGHSPQRVWKLSRALPGTRCRLPARSFRLAATKVSEEGQTARKQREHSVVHPVRGSQQGGVNQLRQPPQAGPAGRGRSRSDAGTTKAPGAAFSASRRLISRSPFKPAMRRTTIRSAKQKQSGGILGVMMSSSPICRRTTKPGRYAEMRAIASIGRHRPWKPRG